MEPSLQPLEVPDAREAVGSQRATVHIPRARRRVVVQRENSPGKTPKIRSQMRFKTIFSWRDCALRARESGFDGMSPGGASIYCSPHPAALQIAPAARHREFAV